MSNSPGHPPANPHSTGCSQDLSARALAWLRTYHQIPAASDLQLELAHEETLEEAVRQLEEWSAQGMRFLTPLDGDYPVNLRRRASPPPFLFLRGELRATDRRCVAVIGTRACSDAGRRRSLKLARALADAGVTVVSGLALGIDTAAHEGALRASGRTLAVVGTGLQTIYPPENRALHDHILETGGAILSQFWPDFTGRKGGANFISRNRTMADMCLATVVVEASIRSGARSQAVHVRKTGGPLFLLRSLVDSEEWAREMAEQPSCHILDEVDDVLRALPAG